MKVKNIGGKIVNIGTTAILPDETVQVSDSYADNPAFTCLVEHGNLAIVKATSGKGGKKNQSDTGGKGDEDGGKGDSGGKDDGGQA